MTAPANPPSSAEMRTAGVGVPFVSTSVAALTAVDLTTKAAWPNASQPPPFATELFVPAAGNITAQMAGETAMQTYACTAGMTLKGAFVLIAATSAVACIARYGT